MMKYYLTIAFGQHLKSYFSVIEIRAKINTEWSSAITGRPDRNHDEIINHYPMDRLLRMHVLASSMTLISKLFMLGAIVKP